MAVPACGWDRVLPEHMSPIFLVLLVVGQRFQPELWDI